MEQGFVGSFTDHHAFLLRRMLTRIDALSTDITLLNSRIEEQIAPFADAVARLDKIPGVGVTAAQVIIAEVGVDMSRFPTAAHLASWARFAPRIKESARSPPSAAKATAAPGTATPTWPGCSAKRL